MRTTGQPGWGKQIFQCLREISMELGIVTKTFGTLTFTGSGHSQSDTMEMNVVAELSYTSPVQSQSDRRL